MKRIEEVCRLSGVSRRTLQYYDNEGKEASLLKVLSDNGVNYIRIRIWNDPYNEKGETYGGGSNDVKAGLEIAKEAAKYNIKVLLGFHYSDFWADPAVQLLPKAWEKDSSVQPGLLHAGWRERSERQSRMEEDTPKSYSRT